MCTVNSGIVQNSWLEIPSTSRVSSVQAGQAVQAHLVRFHTRKASMCSFLSSPTSTLYALP